MSDGSSKGRGQLFLYLTVVAVYLFWGGNFVFSKVALKEMPGTLVAGMRTVIAAALLLAVYKGRNSDGRPPLRLDEYPRLCMIGVFGIAINQICFLVGLSLTSASHAALVISLTPFIVLALAWFRLHRQTRHRAGRGGVRDAAVAEAIGQRADGVVGGRSFNTRRGVEFRGLYGVRQRTGGRARGHGGDRGFLQCREFVFAADDAVFGVAI